MSKKEIKWMINVDSAVLTSKCLRYNSRYMEEIKTWQVFVYEVIIGTTKDTTQPFFTIKLALTKLCHLILYNTKSYQR